MQPEVGAVLEGKVSGVTKFGAFVNLPGDKSGLVHISEIANTFVSDVAQYVSVGQTVKVKVIGINGDKINLSIKRAGGGRSRRCSNAAGPAAAAAVRAGRSAHGGSGV